ncbi:unnamed protein product [Vicia faba]|uniref:Uncharacterized protein n=1 Tax=Vicia faba TaxID=3906 RepID=A0AAV0ZV72_VICFA|nr:unnamed protein product [Vicia faba]
MSKNIEDHQVEDSKEKEEQKNAILLPHSKGNNNGKRHASETSVLIQHLGRDISIQCLLQLSRSYYGSIAALNTSFRSLIRTGELYQLRRKMGIIEHWVYFSCEVLEWEAFDPNYGLWMRLPKLVCDVCFMLSDKESLAIGTELLVFGKELMAPKIYKYSLLTNTWSIGKMLNTPRYLFASASLGGIAILAGGCDLHGNILSSAELYNSDIGKWKNLPNMNKARKMCSGVFMNGKFYVVGGIAADKITQLTCGEEFDMTTNEWREIPDMLPKQNSVFGIPPSSSSPPLIAVVKNVLYVADYAQQEVKKYVKGNNSWITIGGFPEHAYSMNGWGLAFLACGDQLVFLGGPSLHGGGVLEVNAWVPDDNGPRWNRLATKESRSFVRNCTVMGC